MLQLTLAVLWSILGLIHALPALALVQPALITRLYGVASGDTAFVLLQHRAALFGAVVVLCVWAAFVPEVRRPAAIVTAISMIGFLILYAAAGYPAGLRQIAIADLIGLPALGLVGWHAFRSV